MLQSQANDNSSIIIVIESSSIQLNSSFANIDNILDQLYRQAAAQVQGPAPASEKAVDELAKVQVDEAFKQKNVRCTICLEDYEMGNEVSKLSCSHVFHSECVKGSI